MSCQEVKANGILSDNIPQHSNTPVIYEVKMMQDIIIHVTTTTNVQTFSENLFHDTTRHLLPAATQIIPLYRSFQLHLTST